MTIKRLRPSFTFTEERLAELRAVVPEAFADGRVNWEAFKEALGEWTEPEGADAEHFGLFWPGKREARRLAAKPSRGTLVPVPGEGVNEETTRNLFIEGDNLEVLKLLQKSYAGRVKLIYIDPPYNTGNDFVYKDDFRDPLGDYLRKTGQVDEEGEPLTTNTRADGRFHSNWLSMMYPRLRLARNLLADDGLIFVSIDDHEVHHLRMLLSEVFGDENFVCNLIWKKMDSPSRNDPNRAVTDYHEYVVVFARSAEMASLRKKSKPELAEGYQITLPDGRLARRRQLRKNGKGARRQDRPTMWFPLTAPDGTQILPVAPEGWEGRWALSLETWLEREAQGLTEWIERDYGWVPYVLEVLPDELGVPWPTLWTDVDQTRQAKAKFTELMGGDIQFDNPKPTNLLREMMKMLADPSALVLDFFAGSGSTGHAVFEQNLEDGGHRNFILVQFPEPVQQEKVRTIADIAKKRLTRASREARKQMPKGSEVDIGFRVFQLKSSAFRAWTDYDGEGVDQLEALFEEAETPLVTTWSAETLLSEVILLQGFPLDSRVNMQAAFKKNEVRLVTSDHLGHRLWVCLDRKIHESTVSALNPSPEDVIVCLDSALSDEAKLRLADRCTLETI